MLDWYRRSLYNRSLLYFREVGFFHVLLISSVAYLLLPMLIFFIGWLKPILALILSVIAIYAGYIFVVRLRSYLPHKTVSFSIPNKVILGILLINMSLVLISGIGGIQKWQTSDWAKHNAVLESLIDHPWPVFFEIDQNMISLVYSSAYYLPSALVGKISNWTMANIALLIWSFIGMSLASFWYMFLVRRTLFWVILIFILFSGLDGLAVAVKTVCSALINSADSFQFFNLEKKEFINLSRGHLEWWAEIGTYPSNVTSLFWAPQHAIAGWIATSIFYIYQKQSKSRGEILFPFAAVILASPFVFVGLFFYLLFDLKTRWQIYFDKLKSILSVTNISSGLIILVVGLYYFSAINSPPAYVNAPGIEFGLSPLKFYKGPVDYALRLFIFLVLEVGVFVILIKFFSNISEDYSEYRIFVFTSVLLLTIPLIKIGVFNDFMMRTSIPSFFILSVFLGKAVVNARGSRLIIFLGFLILFSINPLVEITRNIQASFSIKSGMLEFPKHKQDVWSISKMAEAKWFLLPQYLGSSNSYFFRYLSK